MIPFPDDADVLMGIVKPSTWYEIHKYVSWKITQITRWPADNLHVPPLLEFDVELRGEISSRVGIRYVTTRVRVAVFTNSIRDEIKVYEKAALQIVETQIFDKLFARLKDNIYSIQRDWVRTHLCEVSDDRTSKPS
jgi:hypothetical protein